MRTSLDNYNASPIKIRFQVVLPTMNESYQMRTSLDKYTTRHRLKFAFKSCFGYYDWVLSNAN